MQNINSDEIHNKKLKINLSKRHFIIEFTYTKLHFTIIVILLLGEISEIYFVLLS